MMAQNTTDGRFDYSCPHCSKELRGDFGDPVYCEACDKTFETDWDYIDAMEGNMEAWLTGGEATGYVEKF